MALIEDLLKITPPGKQFFDELMQGQAFRPQAQAVGKWLESASLDQMRTLADQASAIMYRRGVTFTVYSDAANVERIIPFDVVPRIITASEWQTVERGGEQRIEALNAFIHDVYHEQHFVKEKLVPPECVFGNECFEPWMMGIDLKNPIYSVISGVDLIRDEHGDWMVLEDNLRTPSGVSYMLESRRLSEQLIPSVLAESNVKKIDDYPSLLKKMLSDASGLDDPQIVILTPGRFNSAYYEHAFLASSMEVPLVSGYDLRVKDNKVFIMTVDGAVQVDVIYRRIDDAFIDPIAFNPGSVLGVPGLMSAYRAGNVIIVNAPGTGIADDKSIYPFVDDMIRFYLSEEPILKSVETFLCHEPTHLQHVLANLDKLVVKEARGSGGYGMLIGPKSTKAEQDEFSRRIKAAPEDYIAQPTISLSTCPTLVNEGVAPRHVDLRPFFLSNGFETKTVPGGLTRVAIKKGSLVVNSSQGGGVKDTWVLEEER